MSHINELPSDLATCHALIAQLQALVEQQNLLVEQQGETNETLARKLECLTFELEQLKRHLFGRQPPDRSRPRLTRPSGHAVPRFDVTRFSAVSPAAQPLR
jgi:hypothetical protein